MPNPVVVAKGASIAKKLLPWLLVGALVVMLAPVALMVLLFGASTAAFGGSATAVEAGTIHQQTVCSTSGPVDGLSGVQAANARQIVATAESLGGRAGADIAVMVALAESGLRNLGNTSVPGSDVGQGMGGDHDSVGVFQQRPSMGWGSVAQLLDPAYATDAFMQRLTGLSGWVDLVPWEAAQQVQRSAYDGTPRPANHSSSIVGGNYQAKWVRAQRIVDSIAGTTGDQDPPGGSGSGDDAGGGIGDMPVGCDGLVAPGVCDTGGCDVAVDGQRRGLPEDYTIPESASAGAAVAINFALAQLHKPYVFGGAGPDSFDCSGLMMKAWARAGVQLPHFTGAQLTSGTASSRYHLAPGDLILVPGSDGTLAAPRHVGMYIGRGLVVNAASTRMGILVQPIDTYLRIGGGLSAVRHIG